MKTYWTRQQALMEGEARELADWRINWSMAIHAPNLAEAGKEQMCQGVLMRLAGTERHWRVCLDCCAARLDFTRNARCNHGDATTLITKSRPQVYILH